MRDALQSACERHADVATFEQLGTSEDGRPIDGVVLGRGSRAVSLIAGNHSDEPVGPETLRSFVVHALDQQVLNESEPHYEGDGEFEVTLPEDPLERVEGVVAGRERLEELLERYVEELEAQLRDVFGAE